MRPTLPYMRQPFEALELIVELVRSYCPTLEELSHHLLEQRRTKGLRFYYREGKEDVLYFAWKQVGLVVLERGRFELTEKGKELSRYLHTPNFGRELFRVLVEASTQKFRYFREVYETLNDHAEADVLVLSRAEFDQVMQRANVRSGKEILALMKGCGALKEGPLGYRLSPEHFGLSLEEAQLRSLLRSIESMFSSDARLTYADAMARLRLVHPHVALEPLEPELRRHLWLSASSSVEYIDGIRGGTGTRG